MLLFKTCLFIARWKYVRQQYKNNKLKIIAQTWNDEFEFSDDSYSVSDIKAYIAYTIKSMKHNLLILLFTSIGIIID